MNAEDDTREIPLDESEEGRHAKPDLGPWGAKAVRLGERNRDRMSISAHRPEANPRRWIALAAVICGAGLLSVLGALVLNGDSTTKEIDSKKVLKTSRQPPVAERMSNGARAAHRPGRRRRQGRRLTSHRHSAAQPHTTHPAPGPAYVPVPEPAPASEPAAPSPAPGPGPESPPTTKPLPASGPAVAKEFGFER